jgi:hypothetical protein
VDPVVAERIIRLVAATPGAEITGVGSAIDGVDATCVIDARLATGERRCAALVATPVRGTAFTADATTPVGGEGIAPRSPTAAEQEHQEKPAVGGGSHAGKPARNRVTTP